MQFRPRLNQLPETRRLQSINKAWDRLAHEDPLWAVCVSPDKKGNQWDYQDFYKTGEQEIASVMKRAAQLHLKSEGARALDFGCGVGRLSIPLAARFSEVIGIDVSNQMLALARAAAKKDVNGKRCQFIHNENADLMMLEDASFDFVYSSMVLQHIPAKFSTAYLTDFIRVLKPGGVAIFHIPASTIWTPKGILFRWAPRWLLAAGQRFVLHYPAPMEMHCMSPKLVHKLLALGGAHVVAIDRLEIQGSQWHDMLYYARKSETHLP